MGWMESRCITLVLAVEQLNPQIFLHPYIGQFVNIYEAKVEGEVPQAFDDLGHQAFPFMATYFIGIFKKAKDNVDFNAASGPFEAQFTQWEHKPQGNTLSVKVVKRGAAIIKKAQALCK